MGYENISAMEIYLHVAVGTNEIGVQNPLDALSVPAFARFYFLPSVEWIAESVFNAGL